MHKTLLVLLLTFTTIVFCNENTPTITNVGEVPIKVVQTVGEEPYVLSAIKDLHQNESLERKQCTKTWGVTIFRNGHYVSLLLANDGNHNVYFDPRTEQFYTDAMED